MTPSALILTLHLISLHDSGNFNTVTPGLSIRDQESGYMVGILNNSEGNVSTFAGKLFETEDKHWSLGLGVITGYRLAPVLPLVIPGYHMQFNNEWGMRVNWLPKVNADGANALHFMIEKKL